MANNLKDVIEEEYQNIISAYNSINDYVIQIGVIGMDSKRKQIVGITNAQLIFIHENGSIIKNIPKRPVLTLTIEHTNKVLLPQTLARIEQGCFQQHWTKVNVKQELEKLCIRMQKYARWIIYQSDLLQPNSIRTIAKKHSDRPLLDTGQLAKSITCILKERRQ